MDMDKLICYEEIRQNYLCEIAKLKREMRIWKTMASDIEKIEKELEEAKAIAEILQYQDNKILYQGKEECNITDLHLGMRFQYVIDKIESRKNAFITIPVYMSIYEDFLDNIKAICK